MSDVKRAAQALKLTEQTVRYLMEQGQLAIGYVVQHKSRKRYIVIEEMLMKELEKRK